MMGARGSFWRWGVRSRYGVRNIHMWAQISWPRIGGTHGRIKAWARARVSTSSSSHANSTWFQGWTWSVGRKKRSQASSSSPLLMGGGLGAYTIFLVAASHDRAKVLALPQPPMRVTGRPNTSSSQCIFASNLVCCHTAMSPLALPTWGICLLSLFFLSFMILTITNTNRTHFLLM